MIRFALLLLALANPAFAQPADTRRQGSEFMGASTQAMQKDDALNPGMLWVKDGEALWQKAAGLSGKACVTCHAAASSSMKGVAARYPAFDEVLKRPVTLSQRINICRQKHQQADPLRFESQDLLSLESYIALQSRGLPMTPAADKRLEPFRQLGEQRFMQRMGQLNLSCAQCHDSNAGGRLGSSIIPQAHPNGYPVYRLEWQTMGSLQRRLRNCMSGVRAELFAYGSSELVELEVYLAARATGMVMEAPGVRP
ncbi:MAG: sulfur oxidation c-type cytochrome SoxA [Polaromonas sp.]|uniref:sulfur oxidation c-type cytochrome SoxA n=1 Tax=Polaromonas sp. TaxID=1869339 RepID=UPI0025CF17E0|nr:sulfur oxidation c-type cytochrome SoxA [Polaromonas sp.]MBI2724878.1 sulfur oxidation c-type cytochrome SoxA [Polaromonas sp.]